ncbi:PilN domain-containing protein [Actinoplanes teichomyceticus]|uniref:Fimbrial assembly protein PilN n=1 Tax=Actinoplanes teichomyceticus TaxID=1867 RepID=A0A561VGP7_ACTTI|nr:PilN domain-containing protein [Actinoplanes teichomyceticus]TWG10796.1 fimbrial assembly protein PilN [Actinoplanes teichomyceticus]GIF12584.1 hypothetical protein Ate01nite_26160 [Actinoplanes teichomyceticus]
MTTTALMPLDPSVSPRHAARILPIRANLLPQDISDGRRARRTRAVVLSAAFLVLALLGGWYWHATTAKQEAEKEFGQVTRQITAVQSQQGQFQKLTQTKNSNKVMEQQLEKLLAKDLSWQNLYDLLRSTGDKAGVELTGITGGLAPDDAPGSAANTGLGQLNVTGTAPDKKAVAKYVDALAKLTYVTDPFVTSVTQQDDPERQDEPEVEFTLTLLITDKGLCGRFSAAQCKAGGK